jgi:hypothetical protein
MPDAQVDSRPLSSPPTAQLVPAVNSRAERIAREKEALLVALSAGALDTIQEKVAYVLNRFPGARDSDITLQLRYWETFESEGTHGEHVRKKDLYELPRLTSLARARARIQNTYNLFKASEEIQKRRGVLEEEERQRAREQQLDIASISVYLDESGKTDDQLVVGSVWFLHPPNEAKFFLDVYRWKNDSKFDGEFHFKSIGNTNIDKYLAFAQFLGSQTATLSFKAITLPRRGVNPDEALAEMRYLLLTNGVHHENDTGRAVLPRALIVTKDQENESQDRLGLAALEDRLKQAAQSRFENQLTVDRVIAEDSKGNLLLQIADLFTSSLRRLNSPGNGPKDRFTGALLNAIGMPRGPEEELAEGDKVLHIAL